MTPPTATKPCTTLLITSATATGLGLAARHLTDYTPARTGQSLTGYAAGDTMAGADDSDS